VSGSSGSDEEIRTNYIIVNTNEVLYESATLGPTGINGGATIGHTTTNSWQLGCRFSLTETAQITAVGGHIGNFSLDNGHLDPDAEIYAAIVELDSPSSFPSFLPSEIETHALAAVTFIPGDTSASSADLRVPLSILLEPGNYALIFGTGLFGVDGMAAMALNNPVLPGASFFSGLTSDHWNPTSTDPQDMRFVVEGYTVSIYYVAPFPAGNDGNAGTSPDSPFASVQTAVSAAQDDPADLLMIYMAEGGYSEAVLIDALKAYVFRGGWDVAFTDVVGWSAINLLEISDGSVTVSRLVIRGCQD